FPCAQLYPLPLPAALPILGEMIRNLAASGVSVPNGFATTAEAYREFLAYENLAGRIQQMLDGLDVDDVRKLAETGKAIRAAVARSEEHTSELQSREKLVCR